MKSYIISLALLIVFINCSHSQIVNDFSGKVKIGQADLDNSENSLIIMFPDGTLGQRDASTINSFQIISISNDTIFLANGGFVKLPAGFDGDFSSLTGVPSGLADGDDDTQLTEVEVDAFADNNGYITTEVDGSITNEIQALSISNDTIFLANGGFVKLPAGFDGDFSSLTGVPSGLADGDDDTQLTEVEVDAFADNNGYITTEVDGSITNEIQTLTMSNDTIYLENGGFVVIPEDDDNDSTNELQSFTVSSIGDTLFLSDGNHIIIPNLSIVNRQTLDFLIGGSGTDVANSIQQTTDGGYIVAGYSDSSNSGDVNGTTNGQSDYWVVKLAINGNIEWHKLLGGTGSDQATCIQQTTDGGYIVSGFSSSSDSGDVSATSNGFRDYWVVKLDSNGNAEWDNLLGGSDIDEATSIQQTTDGGYIVSGWSQSSNSGDVSETSNGSRDYWVVKLDSNGNLEWENLLGGCGFDEATSIQQTTDGGYIVVGHSTSSLSGDVADENNGSGFTRDYWVVKLDSNGNVEWENLLGGNGSDEANSIQQTTDGGYIVAGFSSSSLNGDVNDATNGGTDYWVVKIDNNGNVEWENLLGGSDVDAATSAQQTTDGGYIVAGSSRSSNSGDVNDITNGLTDYWVVKLDSNGNVEWENLLGGGGFDEATSIQQTTDGGYIVAGYSTSSLSGDVTDETNGSGFATDYWIIKLDANGEIEEF